MGQKAFTINLPKDKWGFFCQLPRWFGAKDKKISPVARAVAGRVYGVSKSRKKEKELWTSYDQMQEEFGICRATAASAIGKLKESSLIEVDNRDRKGTSYKFVGEAGRGYDVVPLYLYTVDVVIGGIERRLTKAQVHLLAHLMAECKRPKNKGECEGSIARFARELHVSETTIKKAIKVLLKAGLVYRTKEDKGVNGYKLTKYRVNGKLYEYEKYRRAKAKKADVKAKAIADADARAERERYYARRNEEMQARVERYILSAHKKAPRLKTIELEIRSNAFPMARAELAGDESFATLQAKDKALKIERELIYQRFGIEPKRMEQSFYARCKKCQDSGTLPNGAGCKCWMEAGEEL